MGNHLTSNPPILSVCVCVFGRNTISAATYVEEFLLVIYAAPIVKIVHE